MRSDRRRHRHTASPSGFIRFVSGSSGDKRRVIFEPAVAEDPRVTVVVASRNRRDELLSSLARHRAPVILLDNGSTDGTVDAVHAAHPHVRVVALGRNHGAPARNVGVELAETPFVAFADDDSWWAQGSLRRVADLMAGHPRLALVGARILVGPEEREDPVCTEMAVSPLAPTTVGPRLLGFIACGTVVRRDAFLEVGGFDDVIVFPGEEERVAWDLATGGWDLAYVADVVAHHHPSTKRDGADRRRAMQERSALLTAAMRRPWRQVAARWGRAIRTGGVHRVGALAALRALPRAVSRRHPLPPDVEAQVRLLESGARAVVTPVGQPR